MKILVVSQYFWPENFRINDLVLGLIERGHTVTVLTAQPNYPSGNFFEGYGWFGPRRERYAGAEVVRVPVIRRGSGGGLRLLFNYLSFVVTGCFGVFRLPRRKCFDAIFVFQASPFSVGIPAALARWRFKVPMLFWVLDLWPESLTAAGAVRSKWLLRLVELMVRWVYRRCDRVLVQSRAFFPEVMRHGVAESSIRYFPNWGEAVFAAASTRAEIPNSPALPNGFRVLFAGNIGAAQDFPSILEAATLLKERTDIQWVIVGDGRMAAWAKDECLSRGLERTVSFVGQRPLDEMPGFFAAADVLLLSLKRAPIFSLTVPGKLQSYLASGKPVLAMLDGEGARIVTEAGAGIACPSGDFVSLAASVERLAAMTVEERGCMADNGQIYFSENFARERVFDHLDSWLVEVTKSKKERFRS